MKCMNNKKILLKIQYDGSDFCGYQVQPQKRTVQGELNRVSAQLFGCECSVTGCSRTDSGVHARSFYACVEPCSDSSAHIPARSLSRAYNSLLPNDISVVRAYEVDRSFHPRYDVISKEYGYLFYDSESKDPFLNKRAYQLYRPLSSESLLDVNKACGYLVGTYDFTSFMAQGSKIVDPTREIYSAELFRYAPIENLYVFKISGNGFLYNMVRIIAGTMLEVACGKITPEIIPNIIEAKDRTKAGGTLPPYALYLNKVHYNDKNIK